MVLLIYNKRGTFYGRVIPADLQGPHAPPSDPPPLPPFGWPIRPSKSPVSVEDLEFELPDEVEEEEFWEQVFDLIAYPRTIPTTKEMARVIIVPRASSGSISPVKSCENKLKEWVHLRLARNTLPKCSILPDV